MKNSFALRAWLFAWLLTSFTSVCGQQAGSGSTEEAGVHRFATFNVRYANPSNGDTGDKLWANRKAYVGRIVADYDFDIVGMQEVIGNIRDSQTGKTQLDDLRDMLPDYDDWAVERSNKQYQYNVIFYKRDKYVLLDKGRFYLNEHPETPGSGWSTGSDENLPRALGWVRLRDKDSGKEFIFAATHTNYGATESGIESCRLIGRSMSKIAELTPVVLVGDFNMRRNDHNEAWRGVASYLSDAALCTQTTCTPKGNISHTASNWLPATDAGCKGSEFDYIFFKRMIPLSRYIITEDYDRSVAPSDHFPVLVRFKLLSESAQGIETDANGAYQLATPQDLLNFSAMVSAGDASADAVLTQDIDMKSINSGWEPIGTEAHPFLGSFDGQNHKITGFNYTTTGSHAGLFGCIKGSSVSNLTVEGKLMCTNRMNGLVGFAANSDIRNVHSALEINAARAGITHTGGIVGSAQDKTFVECCSFNGTITIGPDNSDCFGGICGYTNTARFENCANYGRVLFAKNDCYAGGILGYVNNNNFLGIHNCLSVGRVRYTGSGSPQYGGAIVGRLRSYNTERMGESYWMATSATAGSGENKSDKFHSVSSTKLQNGEVCYSLNEAQAVPVWYQTLGEDAYPVLVCTHRSVERNEDGTYANPVSIKAIRSEATFQGHPYDLSGRQIVNETMPRGVYIVNGKKVLHHQ